MLWVTPLASKNTISIVFWLAHFYLFLIVGRRSLPFGSLSLSLLTLRICQFFAPGINIVQQIRFSLKTFRVHLWLFARPSTLVVHQSVEALHSHVEIVFHDSMHSTVGIAIQQHFQSSWIFARLA